MSTEVVFPTDGSCVSGIKICVCDDGIQDPAVAANAAPKGCILVAKKSLFEGSRRSSSKAAFPSVFSPIRLPDRISSHLMQFSPFGQQSSSPIACSINGSCVSVDGTCVFSACASRSSPHSMCARLSTISTFFSIPHTVLAKRRNSQP